MRTSLDEIRQAEKYLLQQLDHGDELVFEAQVLTNPLLKMNLFFQQKVYGVVRRYHLKKLKEEAEIIHQRLFSDPAKKEFQQAVFQSFKK